jgi:peptidoglycan-associated lipoprotein
MGCISRVNAAHGLLTEKLAQLLNKEEKMRTKRIGIMLVLCCGLFAVVGCSSKKQVVKEDETLAQNQPVQAPTEAPPAEGLKEQSVTKEPVVKEEPVKETSSVIMPFETIHFDYDSYVLSQDARDSLDMNAKWLKVNTAQKVRLEGNCDERGSDEYNLALGEKRAKAAFNYLVTLGIPEERLSTVSYGKEKPADPGHTEEAWAKNRRVDFVIVK